MRRRTKTKEARLYTAVEEGMEVRGESEGRREKERGREKDLEGGERGGESERERERRRREREREKATSDTLKNIFNLETWKVNLWLIHIPVGKHYRSLSQ